MSFTFFPYQYRPNAILVDTKTGIPTRDGIDFLLALYNRTGAGTGIIPQVAPTLTAKGSSISDALVLMADWNMMTTVPSGSGVQIPSSMKPGNDIEVWNVSLNNLKIYPPSTSSEIDALGNGTAFTLTVGKMRVFQCWTLQRFVSFGN